MSRAAQHVEVVKLTVERVLREYGHVAFLDPTSAFDYEGNLKPMAEWPESFRRSVAGIEFEERFERNGKTNVHVGRLHKIKISNKLGALDSVAKHLGMFVERVGNPDGSPLEPVRVIVEYVDKPSPA